MSNATSNPQIVFGNYTSTIKVMVTGWYHNLVIFSDESVRGWGANDRAQVTATWPVSSTSIFEPLDLSAVLIAFVRNNLSISDSIEWIDATAGYAHTMVSFISKNTASPQRYYVLSWGDNSFGQLGTTLTNIDPPSGIQKVEMANNVSIVSICAGANFSAALQSNGQLWTWGRNSNGQLGHSSLSTQVATPTKVNINATITQIACGASHMVVRLSNGTFMSWGSNSRGQLGSESPTAVGGSTAVPQIVPLSSPVPPIVDLQCGENFCVILASSITTVRVTWGDNSFGQLGRGISGSVLPYDATPVFVVTQGFTQSLKVGKNHAIMVEERVGKRRAVIETTTTTVTVIVGWGWNVCGQLAIDTNATGPAVPNVTIISFASTSGFNDSVFLFGSLGYCHTVMLLSGFSIAPLPTPSPQLVPSEDNTQPPPPSGNEPLDNGAIAGIAIGSAVGGILLAVSLFLGLAACCCPGLCCGIGLRRSAFVPRVSNSPSSFQVTEKRLLGENSENESDDEDL